MPSAGGKPATRRMPPPARAQRMRALRANPRVPYSAAITDPSISNEAPSRGSAQASHC